MPHGPLGDRIPFEGVLNCWNDDHDLPDLLLAISRSGKTGRLHFSNPEGDKTLDLSGGRIVFAESSSQDDGLGQYLLRSDKISLMDYTRVAKMVQPGKRLGELLVEQNILPTEELVPAVIGQVRAVILSLFRRTETWYRFKEQTLDRKEPITLDLAVPELILEGVSHVESWRRVSKGVGSLESVYERSPDRQEEWQRAQLDRDVRELIDMLATPTSLQEICTRATLPDFEACRYLWAFRSLGWIHILDAATLTPVPSTTAGAAETTPADTPTLPSITPPAGPAPIPAELAQTQLAIDTPPRSDAPLMDEMSSLVDETPLTLDEPPSPTPESSEIPERLIRTQVSVTKSTSPSTSPPTPVDLSRTQLDLDAPPPSLPEPSLEPPEDLHQTQLAIDPPTTIPETANPTPAFDDPEQTRLDVNASLEVEPAPRSTGELMESILDGDNPASPSPAPPKPTPPQPSPPVTTSAEPPATPNHAATQFFDGPSALAPMDDDLAAATSPDRATTTPPPSSSATPSGFEALALGGGPGGPAMPPSPADIATQPSVQPPPSDPGMASFSDLALAEEPAREAVPLVEADVIAAEPAPLPPTPAFTPDEPLLPPSATTGPIERESLIPPKRRTDVDARDVRRDSDK